MSTPDKPDWIVAKRKSDHSFRNATLGVWLACFPVALIMIFASRFEYEAAMMIAAALFLITGIGCILVRRGTSKGSLVRSFSTTLAVFGFAACTVTLAAGMVSAG